MRLTALLGCAAIVAGCSPKESAPAVDTTASMAAPAAPAAPMSLASVAGMWNVVVRPEGRDTVVTSYVLDATDSTKWTFTFPKGKPVPMRITGMSGDSIITETDWFDSSVRPGLKAKNNVVTWMQDGKLRSRVVAHYKTTGPDTVRVFLTEGTKQ